MSSFHRKALIGAVLAGIGALASAGSSASIKKNSSEDILPRYDPYRLGTTYSKPKNTRSKQGKAGRKKKSKHRPQKHRMKKRGKR